MTRLAIVGELYNDMKKIAKSLSFFLFLFSFKFGFDLSFGGGGLIGLLFSRGFGRGVFFLMAPSLHFLLV
jgi:hypothetical protein